MFLVIKKARRRRRAFLNLSKNQSRESASPHHSCTGTIQFAPLKGRSFNFETRDMVIRFGKTVENTVDVYGFISHDKRASGIINVTLHVGDAVHFCQIASDRGGTTRSRHIRQS